MKSKQKHKMKENRNTKQKAFFIKNLKKKNQTN